MSKPRDRGTAGDLARPISILGWSLLAASVGLLLTLIETRWKKVGEWVADLLGCAWTLAAYLAVPILVMENKGPISSLKESGRLLRQTWAEQLVGGVSLGVMYFLANALGILALFAGVVAGLEYESRALMVLGVASALFWLLLMALAQSALKAVYQAAIYFYAREGRVPNCFDPELFDGAFGPIE